jgi:hypothetical protein
MNKIYKNVAITLKDQTYETLQGKKVRTKGKDNIFKKVTAENFSNLEKEMDIHV